MKHLITTELSQRQTISPQTYQSLRVLQMNSLELDEYIKEQVLENPVLEQEESVSCGVATQSLDSLREPALSWSWEEGDGRQYDENLPPRQMPAPDLGESLREYLTSQFYPDLDDTEVRLLDSILDFVDETGYLSATVEEIARLSGYPAEYIEYGVRYLQMLDPLGVCARNLTECLCIQLDALGFTDDALKRIVSNHLEDLAAGRFGKISRALGRSVTEARRLGGIIKTLNPKPGACFGGICAPIGIPDVIVSAENGVVSAAVERRGISRLYISGYYERLSRQDEYGEAAAYLEEKLTHAKWVIKAVEGRVSTLAAISDIIAEHQREFFLSPSGPLRPLTLREAAAKLDLHESTISRAIRGKYLQCKRGAFPLKYFFAGRAGSQPGTEDTSRDTVKERIRTLIAAEDKRNPLSDSRIMALLALEGACLSRRVIAKYRGELCIPSASARKQPEPVGV